MIPTPIDLSATETAQLGTERNGIPFMPDRAAWVRFRELLVAKSAQRNPGFFDPSLAAYTPGETEALLQHPTIQTWFQDLQRFEVPAEYEGIVLVPCAASKPWRHHANARKSKLYTAYNTLIDGIEAGTLPKLYFMTVSEPCGIVPQDRWNDFPPYDNPGLFRDDFLRTGLVKTQWAKTFLGARHRLPFDDAAYQRCIDTLGDAIHGVLLRQNRPVLSFVDADTPTTHGAMLDRATRHGDLQIERHAKRAVARVSPLEHLQGEIERFGLTLIAPTGTAPRRRRELR